MTLKDGWRIVEVELWDAELTGLMAPAYILIDDNTGDERASDCVKGQPRRHSDESTPIARTCATSSTACYPSKARSAGEMRTPNSAHQTTALG